MFFGVGGGTGHIEKASYALCFGILESGKFIVPKHCDTKMSSGVYIHRVRVSRTLYDIHTAWATVLLFGTKGNTRASECGTAIVQSRF